MLKFVYDRATIIAISLSFFTFGFVLAAAVYDLSMREVFTGLIAGAVCGITILAMEIANSARLEKQDAAVVPELNSVPG